jgi:hypothetical protein
MRIAANPILRRLIAAAILCLSPFSGWSETPPNFRWVSPLIGSGDGGLEHWPWDLALDKAGNTVMIGTFHNGSTLTIGGVTLSNTGAMFLIKSDRAGNVLWAKADGHRYTRNPSVGLDEAGNIYVLCTPSWADENQLVSLAGTNVAGSLVLAKYDSNGQGLWARALMSAYTNPQRMAVDAVGNSYLLTEINGPVTIGETNVTAIEFSTALIKCNPEGHVLWVRLAANDTFFWQMPALAVDPTGNVYVTDGFQNGISFGLTNLVSRGHADIYVAKYSPDGDLLWVKQSGTENYDRSDHIAVDSAGNCIIAPRFFHTITFDGTTLSNSVAAYYSAIVKYDPNGNVLYAHQPLVTGFARGYPYATLATDGNNNCYFSSLTESTNLLITKYTAAGTALWSKLGPAVEPRFLCADSLGHCYVATVVGKPTVTFDTFTVSAPTVGRDIILAKLDTTTAPPLTAQLAGDAFHLSWSILADDYHLESTPDLASPAFWTSNTASVVTADLLNTVTLPRSASNAFFRLKRP